MANRDSISVTVQNFLSRIETEEQIGRQVQTAMHQLADSGQLSDQNAIEAAIQEEDVRADEAEAAGGEGS